MRWEGWATTSTCREEVRPRVGWGGTMIEISLYSCDRVTPLSWLIGLYLIIPPPSSQGIVIYPIQRHRGLSAPRLAGRKMDPPYIIIPITWDPLGKPPHKGPCA